MPIKRDVSGLPRKDERPNRFPSREPIVVNVLAERWFEKYLASGADNKPHAIAGRRFRLSSIAHRCDRQMWFGMQRAAGAMEPSNPPSIADAWRMGLGEMVHSRVQDELSNLGNGWRSEIVVDLRQIGIDGSGSIDLVRFVDKISNQPMLPYGDIIIDTSGTEPVLLRRYCGEGGGITNWLRPGEWDDLIERPVAVCELKTINGFGWKMAATSFKGPAEGPMYSHILQGALGGWVLKVEDLIVGYLSLENLSPDMAKTFAEDETGRFAGEWHFNIPRLHEILAVEVQRVNRVMQLMDARLVPARELHDPKIPAGAVVDDPEHKGRWSVRINGEITDTGSTWMCGYCDWRDACVSLGADPNPAQSDPI